MTKCKQRSVAPIYAIGLVWVIFTLVHPLCKVSDYVSVILLSALAFVVAKGIWPTVEYDLPDTEEEAGPEEVQDEDSADQSPEASQEEEPADQLPEESPEEDSIPQDQEVQEEEPSTEPEQTQPEDNDLDPTED